MDDEPKSSETAANPGETLTARKAASLLWNSAWEALILAFMIQILGGVAFAMMGNVWGRMTPTLPGEPKLETSSPSNPTFHFGARERFILIFAVVFAGMAFGRLMKFSRTASHRSVADLGGRLWQRASEEWFQLVVVNAFIASILVSVLHVTNQTAPLKLLWGFIAGLVQPLIGVLTNLLPQGLASFTKGLLAWFDANQLKFSFWLLYSAAICDDLGLPNYKALTRWLWRRLKRTRNSGKLAEKAAATIGEKQS
jgi:hypothetical protein